MTSDKTATSALDERYTRFSGRVFLNGSQALVRLAVDQKRMDERAGLATGTFITGYPGSPLGGLHGALGQAKPVLERYGIRHLPAQNEEMAVTSLTGTQMLDQHPHGEIDGVVGFWYGKGPGIDRAGDAIKHGNFGGTSRHGAVVILSGEDHEAKSSTVPYQQEFAFEHFGIPVLYPATVAEFLEFGHHAVALSRYSGCWVAMKLVGALCDGGETVDLDHSQPPIVLPELTIDGRPFHKQAKFTYLPVENLEQERQVYGERHVAVRAYARANRLDRIVVRSDHDRLGIVTAGKSFTDTRQALRDLGFDDAALSARGIRLLKMSLLCPIDGEILREFAQGLDEVIVIEEKRDFLERQVGRALCGLDRPIRLVGKTDETGRPMFPEYGYLDSDTIAGVLAPRLSRSHPLPETGRRRLDEVAGIRRRSRLKLLQRTPNYCSGCPHNVSTKLAPGQVAWGAPGCHIFAALMKDPQKRIEAVTQYGGEGLPWIGLSPYTSRRHIVQNVGDGSLFHSSYLNIRYAVTAGVSMTFKVLYNGATANTGGQPITSAKSLPDLVALLAVEGVKRIVVATKDPRAYRKLALPPQAEVRDASAIEATLKEFEQTPGVTVLVYDGQCANERRRRQKRGLQPKLTTFTVVNEDVCENCGHCGEVANCMSLHKVDTELGPKTRIHQSSCNQDLSCIGGDCPSFVTVETAAGGGVRKPERRSIDTVIPDPALPSLDRPYHVYVPGLGGTGVLTINAILAQAATLDGCQVLSYDLTGAAQKWGPVLSSLIIAPAGFATGVNRVSLGRADLYLALDLAAATDPANLDRCAPGRTTAVVNTKVLPTGDMIRDVRLAVPERAMMDAIAAVTDGQRLLSLDAGDIAEQLAGDYMLTNMVAVGAAYQAGLLPIPAARIEEAIRLNGVQTAANILAFRAGRLSQYAPADLEAMLRPPYRQVADRFAELQSTPSAARQRRRDALVARVQGLDQPTRDLLAKRVEDLVDYHSAAYAKRFTSAIGRVAEAEKRALGAAADGALTRAAIVNLHKLMAVKDEYEVARLLSQGTFHERLAAMFDSPSRVFFHLQPPLLRSLGATKKIRVGSWILPVFTALKAVRRIRGTPLDPFGYSAVRKAERRLVGWYLDLLFSALDGLTPANREKVVAIAELPADIRGYEAIKMRGLPAVQQRGEQLLRQLRETAPAKAAE
jgi:indolepyruvate ferredoxin oxidoreductase